MPEPRKTFGPLVLLGLASGALTAVASTKTWAELDASTLSASTTSYASTLSVSSLTDGAQMPLASALTLLVLACWGVLLVTRGVVRRVLAGVGLLAALGVFATVVVGYWAVPDAVREDFAEIGVAKIDVQWTAWYWTSLVGAVLSVVALALAQLFVRHWPEMGSRYDAPGSVAEESADNENLDLWRSIDEGRDPTA